MSKCCLCGETVKSAFGLQHRKCGHDTHVDCFAKHGIKEDYKHCPECLGQVKAPAIEEPVPLDGVDYVKNPGSKPGTGMLSNVKSFVMSKTSSAPAAVTGLKLLQSRVPITTLMSKHKMGLQHLLKEGVNIEDFLCNGYTWNDIKCYSDFTSGHARGKDTLVALGVRATHLRDYPDALPASVLNKELGLVGADYCTVLGLEFPEMGSLKCGEDYQWTAQDCVNFGLTIADLADFGYGMQYLQQYEDLMGGLIESDELRAEKALGTITAFLEQLIDLEEVQAEAEAEEEESAQEERRQQQQRWQRLQEQDDEEYPAPRIVDNRRRRDQQQPANSRRSPLINQSVRKEDALDYARYRRRERNDKKYQRHGLLSGGE